MTPSRLIAFLAALVLSLAGGSDAAAKSARREILAAVESASSEWARASAERVWENLASEANLASGPRDYPYAQVVEEYTSQGTGAKTLAATFTFADDLVSQTRYANGTPTTRFIQKDGFGSTRWLTDGAAAITDKVDYDAFGVEVARTGATSIEHLYRGESFDPNVGFYNLRARWMDSRVGRFTSMDEHPGEAGTPATLHRFAYAGNDPVGNIDPSGYFYAGETALSTALMVTLAQSATAIATVGIGAAVLATGPGPHFMTEPNLGKIGHDVLARNCAQMGSSPSQCSAAYPILFLGNDVSEHTEFVRSAIQDSWLQPNLHYYADGHDRNWLRTKPAWDDCGPGKTGGLTGMDCDEYPFAASMEGGKDNFMAGRVRLKPVNKVHNQAGGRLLYQKLLSPSACNISDHGRDPHRSGFVVVPVPSLPITAGRCADGKLR